MWLLSVFAPLVWGIVHADIYSVVIDAGSSGNRAFLFRTYIDTSDTEEKIEILSRKNSELRLASFINTPLDAKHSVLPLLTPLVDDIIGVKDHSVDVYVKATGGMRLLTEQEQAAIWDGLIKGLLEDPSLPSIFRISPENFGTISGKLEAYFAVIAANYAGGRINSNMEQEHGKKLIGALDMGGSSTQIIYHVGSKFDLEEFWSHSWQAYGVASVKEKVWNHLIDTHLFLTKKLSNFTETVVDVRGNSGENAIIVPNPCAFRGHDEWLKRGQNSYFLRGHGDPRLCSLKIRETLWREHHPYLDQDLEQMLEKVCGDGHCESGEAEAAEEKWLDGHSSKCDFLDDHVVYDQTSPEVINANSLELVNSGVSGKRQACPLDNVQLHFPMQTEEFYALSVYFFAFDCIRQLGEVNLPWPEPSIDELQTAVYHFCSHFDWSHVSSNFFGKHRYTLDSQFEVRCFESIYLITLLKHAFGFSNDFRGINYAPQLKGGAILEWTLGFLISTKTNLNN